jgi:hypothetical protein
LTRLEWLDERGREAEGVGDDEGNDDGVCDGT